MKSLLLAVFCTILCFSFAYAADDANSQQGGGLHFGQIKGRMLNRIDEKIAQLQAMKACVKSAQSREDMKECREKYGHRQQGAGNNGAGSNPNNSADDQEE